MRNATPELIAFLNSSKQCAVADLYTMQTLSGASRYTGADIDMLFGGNNFSSQGPLIKRGRCRLMRGVEVDNMELTVYASDTMLIEGLPFVRASLQGALDDARITVNRAFMADWGSPIVGTIEMFSGRVSDVKGSRSVVNIDVKSDLELLDVMLPRPLYQSSCIHTLYGPGCGVQRGSFLVTSAAAAGSSTVLVNSALAQAAGWFDQGVLEFTSGANIGLRRTVKSFASGAFTFMLPLPFAPANGDTFKATPGCDKKLTTCTSKYSNQARHRAYPFVPAAETAY